MSWERVDSDQKKDASPSVDPPKENQGLDLVDSFRAETPKRMFEDLVVTEKVRHRIKSALSRIRHHKKLYEEWQLRKVDPHRAGTAINLFGPPGTGKTFCAEAIAHYLNKKIIRVNYAEIESKYVGETPKNITAAFRRAKEADAVLFFDESDSILGKRLTNITQSADHGVNVSRAVMLTQLDSFGGVVVFATNLARNYDGAFVRRILAHIEFELPDLACRERLWRFLIPTELPRSSEVDPVWLARHSTGLSGGDMLNVVVSSASRAVQRTDPERRVERQDVLEEIEHVRTAKIKIGAPEEGSRVLSEREEVVNPEDLPPVARERFLEREGSLSSSASSVSLSTADSSC